MKQLVLGMLAALFTVSASAQMKGMEMKHEHGDSKAAVHKAKGVVTAIDPANGKVMIKHEPIQSLNWPAMTMGFTVKDKAVLAKIRKNQEIDFEFVEQGKDYVITAAK